MSSGLRVCKKCLLREQAEASFEENLEQYITNLSEEDRVSQESYEQRLKTCSTCGHLMKGMCRKCGCFVELRAALKVRKCPDVPARWEKQI